MFSLMSLLIKPTNVNDFDVKRFRERVMARMKREKELEMEQKIREVLALMEEEKHKLFKLVICSQSSAYIDGKEFRRWLVIAHNGARVGYEKVMREVEKRLGIVVVDENIFNFPDFHLKLLQEIPSKH